METLMEPSMPPNTTVALRQDPQKAAWLDRIERIPVVKFMEMEFEAIEEGYCRARVPRKPEQDGSFESFHGGMLGAIADTIACFAVMPCTDPSEILTTTDMNVRFLAACLTDVVAEARTIKLGKTLCPVSVELFDTQGKKVAIATVTYMRLQKMPNRS